MLLGSYGVSGLVTAGVRTCKTMVVELVPQNWGNARDPDDMIWCLM